MKGKILLLGTFFLLFFLPVPSYVELNDLALIQSMNITCLDSNYMVTLYEVLPKKEDNGIQYDHQSYKKEGKDFTSIKASLEMEIPKKIYYQGIQKITTNCSDISMALKTFSLDSNKIKIERNS